MSGRPIRRYPSIAVRCSTSGRVNDVAAARSSAVSIALADVRLEAPIPMPPEFLAIGLNYADHVAESVMDRSAVPIVFNKQITCVTGPFDPIEIPTAAPTMVDYEGELGVVIGTRCRAVSARPRRRGRRGLPRGQRRVGPRLAARTPTMTMGKSWDTHGPIGPWLVTADEIADPHDLRVRTWVDDDLRQDASTAAMINNCWELIEHLSTAFTLLPGTIISTGTPSGVGIAMKPARSAARRPDRADRDRRHRHDREPGRCSARRVTRLTDQRCPEAMTICCSIDIPPSTTKGCHDSTT